jgi:hypothetical protein
MKVKKLQLNLSITVVTVQSKDKKPKLEGQHVLTHPI